MNNTNPLYFIENVIPGISNKSAKKLGKIVMSKGHTDFRPADFAKAMKKQGKEAAENLSKAKSLKSKGFISRILNHKKIKDFEQNAEELKDFGKRNSNVFKTM